MGNSLSSRVETAERPSMRKGQQRASASRGAPAESAASGGSAEDAEKQHSPDAALGSSAESLEAEKSRPEGDAAVGAQAAAMREALEGPEDAAATTNCGTEQSKMCSECDRVEGSSREVVVRVCTRCGLAVHRSCYGDVERSGDGAVAVQERDDAAKSAAWQCDCCRHGVSRLAAKCAYCGKVGGDAAMRVVDKTKGAAFWSQCSEFKEDVNSSASGIDAVHFGHVLCVNWDPRRLAAHVDKERKICATEDESKPKLSPSSMTDASNGNTGDTEKPAVEELKDATLDWSEMIIDESLPPTECCFCHSTAGVQIQCRRVSCARFFHAMCAHHGNGHVELRTTDFPQFHAYCDRHRDCTQDLGDFMGKLLTRHMRLLVGRDESKRFHTLSKRMSTHRSAGSVLRFLASLFVSYCNKGLRNCKSDPPDYNMKQLQALQFFLGNLPQLEKVYALPETTARDIVDDKKLFRRLEKAFDPRKYLAKYPGPFSQQYTCDVCLDPFHERQHLFYCSGGDGTTVPHVQHWRCTKRRSNVRERERYMVNGTSSKKKRKTISVVQDGVRKDITIPKGLQSMTDDIICGVCRAPVDARGLIASRKEAKRLDFAKKESRFVQSGCYINPLGSKVCAGFAQSVRPPPSAANASTRRPSSKASNGKTNGSVTGNHTAAQPELGPPKMDRINVQRTTRWLACVGQIIRLAAPAPKLRAPPLTPVSCKAPAATSVPAIPSIPGAVPVSTTAPPPSSTVPAAPATISNSAATPAPAFSVTPASNATPVSTLTSASALTTTGTTAATPATAAIPATASSPVPPTAPSPVVATVAVVTSTKLENGVRNTQTKAEIAMPTATSTATMVKPTNTSLVSRAMQAYFDEAMRLVRPYDPYALSQLETAHEMLVHRSGPGVAVLRMLTQEYTRFVYIKHTRAVEKARNQKRKRAEHEAQEFRERERKRISREAEEALKSQMLAMRNKQRQHLKATSSKQKTKA